jgi:DNA adenine methylase
MRINSPLRYPGGKASLATFLADVIDLNDLRGCKYYEPYAGGAGAALNLLLRDVVSELYLNDADKRLYAFWISVLNNSERFVDRIQSTPLTIEEWRHQYTICANPETHNMMEIGFAAFYMNRCNRSGVLTGAGPIGGYGQKGKWRMDVRFNREELSLRILALARFKKRIHVTCQDAVLFLKSQLPRGQGRRNVFVYLDPPYVNNGQRLYLNAYKPEDHGDLAQYLAAQRLLHWVVSYDDSNLIRDLYNENRIMLLPIQYSLQVKRAANELVITPRGLTVPKAYRIRGQEYMLQAA